jgi:hypothetical protein
MLSASLAAVVFRRVYRDETSGFRHEAVYARVYIGADFAA